MFIYLFIRYPEFVGLRPKMYNFTYDEVRQSTADGEDQHMEKEKKVAKGIAKSEIKRTLRHAMYRNCLFEETTTFNSMTCIRSQNHELFIDQINKKGLCSFDDKRYWNNSVDILAFGHFKINIVLITTCILQLLH